MADVYLLRGVEGRVVIGLSSSEMVRGGMG